MRASGCKGRARLCSDLPPSASSAACRARGGGRCRRPFPVGARTGNGRSAARKPRAEPVEIASASGATLRGWFIEGRPGGGAVVLMHGVQRRTGSACCRRARFLTAAGFSVLMFDFQAHGESTRRSHHVRHAWKASTPRAAVAWAAPATAGRAGRCDRLVARRRRGAARSGAAARSMRSCSKFGLSRKSARPSPIASAPFWARSIGEHRCAAAGVAVRGAAAARHWRNPASRRPSPDLIASAEVTAPVLVAAGTLDDRTTIAEATRDVRPRARSRNWFGGWKGPITSISKPMRPSEYVARARAWRFVDCRRRRTGRRTRRLLPASPRYTRADPGDRSMSDMRLIVAGAGGRMGRTLIQAITADRRRRRSPARWTRPARR